LLRIALCILILVSGSADVLNARTWPSGYVVCVVDGQRMVVCSSQSNAADASWRARHASWSACSDVSSWPRRHATSRLLSSCVSANCWRLKRRHLSRGGCLYEGSGMAPHVLLGHYLCCGAGNSCTNAKRSSRGRGEWRRQPDSRCARCAVYGEWALRPQSSKLLCMRHTL